MELENISSNLVSHARFNTWVEIGQFIETVKKTGHWANKSDSFTSWLVSYSKELGVTHVALWNYLRAVKFYKQLTHDFKNIQFPKIDNVPSSVNPDSLQILEKLYPVATPELLEDIATRILKGTITRAELRKIWHSYRDAPDAKSIPRKYNPKVELPVSF